MLCTVCATGNLPDSLYCRGCGTSLESFSRLMGELDRKPAPPPEAPAGPVTVARLVPRHDGIDREPALLLSRSPLLVGRFSPTGGPVDLDLALSGPAETVSRRHALFFFDAGSWHVQDLGSSNGTFVRREGAERFDPCRAPVAVEHGDEIAFGNRVFVLRGI